MDNAQIHFIIKRFMDTIEYLHRKDGQHTLHSQLSWGFPVTFNGFIVIHL